jgi:TM2 domain-containing membrane protein YozV
MDAETQTCPFCAETIKVAAVKCRYCGEFLNEEDMRQNLREARAVQVSSYNPGLAAALSTVWPGLGQIFQGRLALGLTAMILMILLVSLGMFSKVLLLIPAIVYAGIIVDAYNYKPITNI